MIAANDNWSSSPGFVGLFAAAGAFAFVARSPDAALLVTLPPGPSTAQVAGAGGTTGVAPVEVYTLR